MPVEDFTSLTKIVISSDVQVSARCYALLLERKRGIATLDLEMQHRIKVTGTC